MEQTGPSSNLLLPSLSTYLNQRPADFFVFPVGVSLTAGHRFFDSSLVVAYLLTVVKLLRRFLRRSEYWLKKNRPFNSKP
jgi:hypothetical protein